MKSRFEKELSGELGDFWKKHAEEEIEKMRGLVEVRGIIIDENGAASWSSNGSYLPSHCVEILVHTGVNFSVEATNYAREKQNEAFLNEYRRKNYSGPTDEELLEMRAAFGKGTKVVDVISGREFIV